MPGKGHRRRHFQFRSRSTLLWLDLTVATTNTGAFLSCIHDMKLPKTLLEVPPSVASELLVPLNPFSTSSIHRQQGAMASAVWMTARRLDSDCPTNPAKILPASSFNSGTPNTFAVALAVRLFPVPGMPIISNALGVGRPDLRGCD